MNFSELASKIIPGYDLLSQTQKDDFEATEIGQHFVNGINELLVKLNIKNNNPSRFSYVYSMVSSLISADYEQEKEKFKAECIEKANTLINAIHNSEEYKGLIATIIFKFLEEQFIDFPFLTHIQQFKLAQAPFSLPLQSSFLALKQEREETQDPFLSAELIAQQEAIYEHWLQTFNTDAEMALLRERIALQKGQKRARKLAKLFPLLNEIAEFPNPSVAEEFVELYCEESKKENSDLAIMEEQFLAKLVFRYFQTISAKHINFINLQDFNQKEAISLARDIIRAADNKEDLRLDLLSASYGYAFRLHLRQGRLLINNKILEVETTKDTGLLNSLSYLFLHSKALDKTREFLKKYGDAHAIIQYTGFSTQNESSYLGLLDVYNYSRSAEHIAETRTIFTSLMQPFISLYEEYKDIALYEKNGFRKIIRILMPLLIVAGIVVLVGAMLSPLAIPEFAFLIAAIPAVLIGIYLASKYVTWKNEIYLYVYQNWLNDGPFEIPEFQVNARLIAIFGNEENAQVIRSIYIEELKHCDDLEKSFSERAEIGGTEQEIELRRENIKKRHTLALEWYDIHSNLDLGYDLAPKIVEGRLIKILNEEIVQLEQDCQDSEDLKEIDTLIAIIVDELKTTFAPPNNNGNEVVLQVAEPDNANRFFKPKSVEHQQKAERIDLALTMVRH
jgi:hypothetical protein